MFFGISSYMKTVILNHFDGPSVFDLLKNMAVTFLFVIG